jgi:hypothetical protein
MRRREFITAWLVRGEGSKIMRMLIVTLSAALMLLSIAPQAVAAKPGKSSHVVYFEWSAQKWLGSIEAFR